MKFNWGFGIVIAFVCFIAFILNFVFVMSTSDKADHELVTSDYYKAELNYQQEIDAETNSRNLEKNISLAKTEKGLLIKFPENFDYKYIKGKVFLYRPSNEVLDFNYPITLSSSHLLIPASNLLDGRWNIKIDWQYEETPYLFKKEIVY